ncbi:MAG: sulfatase [Planctomycetota bacterium]
MRTLLTALFVLLACVSGRGQDRPNVLFIIVDDLNDMPLHPDGKPFVPTPNFDRLAARGVSFTNAHCNDPICAPSRSSMLTGLYPQTSSLYWFEDYRQNAILSQSVTLTEHLATNGYDVYTVGKIYHGNQDPKGFYADRGLGGNIGPWPWDGTQATRRGLIPHPQQLYMFADDADPDMDYKWEHTFGPLTMVPEYPADPDKKVPGYRGWRLSGKPWRYVSDDDRDRMPDETNAAWAADVLKKKHDQPFVLFTGFSRTHTPLYAPQNYFDKFPLDQIQVPACYVDGDLKDCAPSLADRSLYAFRRYQMLFHHEDRPQLYKRWLQAYMACVSFIDDQVGTVLDALEASEHADDTVVFLTSDHGFHVGGKEALYKQTLWDSGTRIPFIVAGLNGMPRGVTCDQPISLIDVYPTFIDLCDLPQDPNAQRSRYPLDGDSLKPLIMEPKRATWTGPDVAITALPGKDHSQHREHLGTLYPHFSVRGKDWRYSLTSDGQEELYHYSTDPYEFKNLADDPAFAEKKSELKAKLIALRDGDRWQDLKSLPTQPLTAFEIVGEIKGNTVFNFGESTVGQCNADDWTPIRLRVAGKRTQLWLNHRVHFDEFRQENSAAGVVRLQAGELRNLRLRKL